MPITLEKPRKRQTRSNNSGHCRSITAIVSGLLALSLISLALVAERLLSALWQGYKFYGYEHHGVITLSAASARIFIVSCLFLLFASIGFLFLCKAKDVLLGEKLSTITIVILLISIIGFAALGLSPLNQWRP